MKGLSYIPAIVGILMAVAPLGACDDLILLEEPGNNYREMLETIWTDIDRNYSYFSLKALDWDTVYFRYMKRLQDVQTDSDFFNEMSDMLDHLKDIHVNLYISQNVFYSYINSPSYPDYPQNFYPEILDNNYLEDIRDEWPYISATVKDGELGYIRIISFGASQAYYKRFSAIIERMASVKGLIIDVRDNGGGGNDMSQYIAGFFTDSERIYGYSRRKSGPGHEDFTEWKELAVSPISSSPFSKPVVLLTNRGCFSSTEDFVLAMKQFPGITVVGDTTGGGSGNPVHRELPNGWTYRFSTWQLVTPQKTSFEGTGLIPDLPIWIAPADTASGHDTILDQAILELNNR